MPDVAVPAVPPLSSLRRVELIHTGEWKISTGKWRASPGDLVAAVAALDCPAVRRPVVKLGHSHGEEPLWEGNPTGAPAVGWVDNLALTNQGHTLVGDFVGMPGWFGAVAASAYPDRSVEGTYDHLCQLGHTHPFVLTAVALLGITPPGVGTLRSLQDVGRLYGVQAATGTQVVARFDPNQPRDGNGRWTDGDGTIGGGDRLGLAGRIPLADGERLVASGRVEDSRGDADILLAHVETPDGPQLRVGVIPADDASRWSGANRGGTARVDAAELRQAVADAAAAGEAFRRDYLDQARRVEAEQAHLPEEDRSYPEPDPLIAQGVVPGGWGDVLWEVWGTDDTEGGWALHLAVQPRDGDEPAAEATLEGAGPVRTLLARAAGGGEVTAHLAGRHNQQSHGNRIGRSGPRRLTRGGRRGTVRALNRLIRALEGDESATQPGMSGGPLLDLVDGIRRGVDGGQFTPDQAFQMLASLVFRPDVASNPRLSTALAEAVGRMRGGLSRVAAAADVANGAMVALLPSDEDAARLAVDGGEPADQLHMTVLFLGQADAYPPAARLAVVDAARDLARLIPAGDADGMAIAAFNPDKPDKDTCVVLELGGEPLDEVRGLVGQAVTTAAADHGLQIPDQHTPWRPHITLLYNDDLMNVPRLADRAGPVRLDRIRVAFAGEHVDIPLTGGPDAVEAQAGSDRPLRNYWLYGAGAAKIRWRTPGDFTRCVRQLSKYVRDPQGLCAEYHFEANGFWPGDRRNLMHAAFDPDQPRDDRGRWIECQGCGEKFQTKSRAKDIWCLGNERCQSAYDAAVEQVEQARREARRSRRQPRQPRQYQPAYGDYGQLGAFLGAYRDRGTGGGSRRAEASLEHTERATRTDLSAEEAIILPNPNPTIVHASTRVSVDDVRTAYYAQAPQRAWIREFHVDGALIVANDQDGSVARVDFDVDDDGTIRFGQPVPVRVEYVADDQDQRVAASRLVYASAAESRPGANQLPAIFVDRSPEPWRRQPPPPPGFEPAAAAGGDHWKRQPRDTEGQWTDTPGRGGAPNVPNAPDLPRMGSKVSKMRTGGGGGDAADAAIRSAYQSLARGEGASIDADELDGLLRTLTGGGDEAKRANLAHLDVGGYGTLFRTDKEDALDRSKMPQLGTNEEEMRPLLDLLKDRGVDAHIDENVDPTTLKPSQSEISGAKTGKLYGFMVKDGWLPGGLLVVSNDGYVADGHHRWSGAAAARASGERPDMTVGALVVDLPIGELLQLAMEVARFESLEFDRESTPQPSPPLSRLPGPFPSTSADEAAREASRRSARTRRRSMPAARPTPVSYLPGPFAAADQQVTAAAVSSRPWSDYTEADYTPQQWRAACLVDRGPSHGDENTKARYGLPVREPGGTLNRNGVHAAAGGHGISAVQGITTAQRRAVARRLVGLYRQLGDTPPPSLLQAAGMSMSAAAHPQTPAAEPGNPTTEEEEMPLSTEVLQRLGLAEDADVETVSAAVAAALDKADQAPDPTQVAAAAAERDELSKEVDLLKGQVGDLSAQIAAQNAEKAAQVKASVLDTAQEQGKFAPTDRAQWEADYDESPKAVTRVLASIAPGTAVPVQVSGNVGRPWEVVAGELPPEPDGLFSEDSELELAGVGTGKAEQD